MSYDDVTIPMWRLKGMVTLRCPQLRKVPARFEPTFTGRHLTGMSGSKAGTGVVRRSVATQGSPSGLASRVLNACSRVREQMRDDHSEAAFKAALAGELTNLGLPHTKEAVGVVTYEGQPVAFNRADFLVDGKLVVEVKSVRKLSDRHRCQLKRYMAVFKTAGLLVNFKTQSQDGTAKLEHVLKL